ncbi:MAG: hypothetical protein NC225_08665 [Clostridium sp.]|nr:hypothetical protein [Clostridium sp.]MCM1460090.1 hypothetical protein [Bacteroides sp.]
MEVDNQGGKMSHSKYTKRGFSLYLDKWNPSAKKYINVCSICGCKGYSPVIEQEGFCYKMENQTIYNELTKTLHKMELDDFGRCADCAKVQDGK